MKRTTKEINSRWCNEKKIGGGGGGDGEKGGAEGGGLQRGLNSLTCVSTETLSSLCVCVRAGYALGWAVIKGKVFINVWI